VTFVKRREEYEVAGIEPDGNFVIGNATKVSASQRDVQLLKTI
jgi:hypothetical protein